MTSGEFQEYATRIKTSSEQMSELITDLLDLGKIEAGVGEIRIPCQLEELVATVVETASFQAELRQLTLRTNCPEALPPVLGDRGRLRQVLNNLIGNALKYTTAGGTIDVRAWEEMGRVHVEVQERAWASPVGAAAAL